MKKERKRFRVNAVVSVTAANPTETYIVSKKLHVEYIKTQHEKNKEEIIKISSEIEVKHYFIKVFGKLMEITEADVERLKESYTIIIK